MPRFAYLLPSRIEHPAEGKAMMRWLEAASPFDSDLPMEVNSLQTAVRVLPAAFTAEECALIVALGQSGARVSGDVVKGYAEMRVSELTWIDPVADARWLYHRVGMLLLKANATYGFRLMGLQEPLQFSRYAAGGKFDWHVDAGGEATAGRKLSLSIQLSSSADYDGGDLEFLNNAGESARALGTAVVFPSFLAHRVAPVSRGLRQALIAWAYGPSFV